ncbi:hypothetical protein DDZ13_00210 [Coraliomargarita sinensis]|uniref:Uncharacterized protein n=1 Tax=Coraliomargarita sinensis TaxID=2174842 RepID=A0A317ZM60_9BACT|nr:hypothetical protein [Coraliomargarita sinensis]PXA05323.1 hypothetical protein DDZ13_00210 [Coraliomargarita sinensis]
MNFKAIFTTLSCILLLGLYLEADAKYEFIIANVGKYITVDENSRAVIYQKRLSGVCNKSEQPNGKEKICFYPEKESSKYVEGSGDVLLQYVKEDVCFIEINPGSGYKYSGGVDDLSSQIVPGMYDLMFTLLKEKHEKSLSFSNSFVRIDDGVRLREASSLKFSFTEGGYDAVTMRLPNIGDYTVIIRFSNKFSFAFCQKLYQILNSKQIGSKDAEIDRFLSDVRHAMSFEDVWKDRRVSCSIAMLRPVFSGSGLGPSR